MQSMEKRLSQLTNRQGIIPNVVVSINLERKIRKLASKIPNLEWSGVLFYTSDGKLSDGTLVLTALDVHLMDIGSSGRTSFEVDESVISYMTANDLLDTEIGLIHSHHTMDTFFSGTDINTLTEEAHERSNFLSLIVNNAGKYNAIFTAKMRTPYQFWQVFEKSEVIKDSTSVCRFNCAVSIEEDELTELEARFLEVYKPLSQYSSQRVSIDGQTELRFQGDSEDSLKNVTKVSSEISSIKIDQDFVDQILLKILLTTPLASTKELSLESVIPDIERRFSQVFGEPENSFFRTWMSEYISTVLYYTVEEDKEEFLSTIAEEDVPLVEEFEYAAREDILIFNMVNRLQGICTQELKFCNTIMKIIGGDLYE